MTFTKAITVSAPGACTANLTAANFTSGRVEIPGFTGTLIYSCTFNISSVNNDSKIPDSIFTFSALTDANGVWRHMHGL